MSLSLVAAPASEPVTLAEAKAHLRVDHADDEPLIASLITAARETVEGETGRAMVTQTWRLDLFAFPDCDGAIDLPKPPAASVSSIQYVDPSGTLTTLAGSAYTLLAEAGPRAQKARIVPAYGAVWPTARDDDNAVRVTFVCGSAVASVPAVLKAALKLHLGDLYANREGAGPVKIEPSPTIARLLAQYRVEWWS